MDLGIDGRCAVVTGGSKGIGLAIAQSLASAGVTPVISARRQEPLDAAVVSIRELGTQAVGVAADLATSEGCATLAEEALAECGTIDILVNNVGGGLPTPIEEQAIGDWRANLELNLLSAVQLSSLLVPGMGARGWGRVVNVGSRQGREPQPDYAPYAAAKAALISYSKSLSLAYSAQGVMTNCVLPGLVRTEVIEQAMAVHASQVGKTVDEVFEATLRRRPSATRRAGQPHEVADLVVFLASERASWITGGCFNADGGGIRSAI